jgi:hypothetical protein
VEEVGLRCVEEDELHRADSWQVPAVSEYQAGVLRETGLDFLVHDLRGDPEYLHSYPWQRYPQKF